MKKVVIQLNIHSDKEKQKASKAVSSIQGVESLSMDMEAKKMTIIGDVDPVEVICKLRRSWCPEIISVGPKEEPKKDEEAKKKEEEKKKQEEKKKEDVKCVCASQQFPCQCYRHQNPCYQPNNYVVHCVEECPPSCVIA